MQNLNCFIMQVNVLFKVDGEDVSIVYFCHIFPLIYFRKTILRSRVYFESDSVYVNTISRQISDSVFIDSDCFIVSDIYRRSSSVQKLRYWRIKFWKIVIFCDHHILSVSDSWQLLKQCRLLAPRGVSLSPLCYPVDDETLFSGRPGSDPSSRHSTTSRLLCACYFYCKT